LIPSSNETDGENETSACAWIETIDEDVAEGELAEAYEVCAERSSRRAAHIYKVQGLSPRAMVQHRALYRTLVFGPSPLERYQREMVGVVVSGINGCHY
jgi:alkylhydroperoxidase family enzyme